MRSLRLLTSSLVLATSIGALAAELRDTAPLDQRQVLDLLEKLRAQQEATLKQRRTNAIDTVKAAMTSGDRAAALWKEAVKTIHYEGAEDSASKLRSWREGDGEALSSREVQTAAKLHVTWLYYTLQFHSGVKKKELLPFVIDYTNQLAAAGQTMEAFEAQLEKEKERQGAKNQQRRSDDTSIKRVHDTILRTSVSSSPLAKYLGLDTILPKGAGQNERTAKRVASLIGSASAPTTADDVWPMTPGDLEGIHQALILPEYRASKDPRILEYWESVIKRETENGGKKRTDFEEKQFNELRRPELIWKRAEDILSLGLRNRAIGDMLAIVRTYPLHPNFEQWLAKLETTVRGESASLPSPSTSTPPTAAPPVVK